MMRRLWIAGLSCLAMGAADALGGVLDIFRPVERWAVVERVEAVPGERRMEFSGTGEIIVNGEEFDRSIPYLFTEEEYGDVHIELEFMVPTRSNSGVYVMGRYEIQIFDSHGRERVGAGDLGGLYARHDPEANRTYEGTRPLVNAARPPGEWQTMEIFFRAPVFDETGSKVSDATFERVLINGELVQANATTSGPTASAPLEGEVAKGPVAIQGDHGPVAIRNFRATPLGDADEERIAGLDAFWETVSEAVRTGDFETFRPLHNPDGVLISGRRGWSEPLAHSLARWETGFANTREGRVRSEASFRWKQRRGDRTTAIESGILRFVSQAAGEEEKVEFIDFEAVLIRHRDGWKLLTEYQKGEVPRDAWDALE